MCATRVRPPITEGDLTEATAAAVAAAATAVVATVTAATVVTLVNTAAVAAIAELHGSICLVTYRVWFGIPLVIDSDPKGACVLPG